MVLQDINNYRVVGFKEGPSPRLEPCADDESPVSGAHPCRSFEPAHTTFQLKDLNAADFAQADHIPLLAVVADAPAEVLLAQDMFSTFMWAVAEKLSPLEEEIWGETIAQPSESQNADAWKYPALDNRILSKLSREVERTAGRYLGTLDDIKLSMLPPLSLHRKLPVPYCLVEYARDLAKSHEALNRWTETKEVYVWLFNECQKFGPNHNLAIKGTAILFEYSETLQDILQVFEMQQREEENIDTLKTILEEVQHVVESGDSLPVDVNADLKTLRGVQTLGASITFRGLDGATPLHDRVIDAVHNGQHFRSHHLGENLCHLHVKDVYGLTALHYAVIGQCGDAVKELLEGAADPNATDVFRWTPLHYAVRSDYGDIVELLLNNASIKARSTVENLSGYTPFHYSRSDSVAWRLLNEGVRADTPGRDGTTALHCAAKENSEAVAKLLVEAGANADSLDSLRRTPLHWAAFLGHTGIVEILRKKGADTAGRDDSGRTPLHLAAVSGNLTKDLYKLLYKDHGDLMAGDRRRLTPLHLAAIAGRETVVVLLAHGLSAMDRHGRTSLSWAAEKGHEAVVKLLCARDDADINSKDTEYGQSPLSWAAAEGHEAVVKLLCERDDVEVNSQSKNYQTPLSYAAINGHEAVVKHLCARADVEINSKDSTCGQSALSWAATDGHEAVVKYLCERDDVEINSKDTEYGHSPLSWAALNGHEAVVKLLCQRRDIDIDSRNNNGRTALAWAARNGQEEVVRYLCKRNEVDPNCPDKKGRTPLLLAAKRNQTAVVRVLCEREGVNGALRDETGKTPLAWAMEREHHEVVQILLEFGCTDDVPISPLNGSENPS